MTSAIGVDIGGTKITAGRIDGAGRILTQRILPTPADIAETFAAIDATSHSASDTLYGAFPFFASAFLLFDWVAGRTSRQSD